MLEKQNAMEQAEWEKKFVRTWDIFFWEIKDVKYRNSHWEVF